MIATYFPLKLLRFVKNQPINSFNLIKPNTGNSEINDTFALKKFLKRTEPSLG